MNTSNDPKQIIIELLTIINFEDNKERFAEEFLTQCLKLTIIEAIDSLEETQKKNLLDEMHTKKSTDEMREILLKYISEQTFQAVLQTVTQKQFESYIEHILPTLNSTQKDALLDYLSNLSKVTES